LKVAAVLGGIVAASVVATGVALADDEVHGGHCEYGDFSVNLQPSCDTNNSDGSDERLGPLQSITETLRPALHDLAPALR
jgi:hypothetical protein